ncbi:MAG: hypothetical protein AAF541_15230 [Pseudomonadota bacterium]
MHLVRYTRFIAAAIYCGFCIACTGCAVLLDRDYSSVTPGQPAQEAPNDQQPHPLVPTANNRLPKPIAIVTDGLTKHSAIEQALMDRLAHKNGGQGYVRYSLENAKPQVINSLLQTSGIREVITIGEAATQAVPPDPSRQVVFCAVDAPYPFLKQGYLGVAPHPSLALQLAAWLQAYPDIKQIGVLSSQAFGDSINTLSQAAEQHDVVLFHEYVSSDTEALFVFENMGPNLDAFIYLPDPEVLTPNLVRNIQIYAKDKPLKLLAYTPAILNLPGVYGVTPSAQDITEQLMQILTQPYSPQDTHQSTPAYRLLTRAEVKPGIELTDQSLMVSMSMFEK